jgi:hypothetical protein
MLLCTHWLWRWQKLPVLFFLSPHSLCTQWLFPVVAFYSDWWFGHLKEENSAFVFVFLWLFFLHCTGPIKFRILGRPFVEYSNTQPTFEYSNTRILETTLMEVPHPLHLALCNCQNRNPREILHLAIAKSSCIIMTEKNQASPSFFSTQGTPVYNYSLCSTA